MRSVFGSAAAALHSLTVSFCVQRVELILIPQKGNMARNVATFSQSLPVPLMRRHVGGPMQLHFGLGEKVERWEGVPSDEGRVKNDACSVVLPFSAIVQPKTKLGLLKVKGEKRLENTSPFLSVIRNEKRCVHSSSIHPEV